MRHAGQAGKQFLNFINGQDRGNVIVCLCSQCIYRRVDWLIQDMLVQEQQRRKCLVLCRGGSIFMYRKIGSGFLFFDTHFGWMALVVGEAEENCEAPTVAARRPISPFSCEKLAPGWGQADPGKSAPGRQTRRPDRAARLAELQPVPASENRPALTRLCMQP